MRIKSFSRLWWERSLGGKILSFPYLHYFSDVVSVYLILAPNHLLGALRAVPPVLPGGSQDRSLVGCLLWSLLPNWPRLAWLSSSLKPQTKSPHKHTLRLWLAQSGKESCCCRRPELILISEDSTTAGNQTREPQLCRPVLEAEFKQWAHMPQLRSPTALEAIALKERPTIVKQLERWTAFPTTREMSGQQRRPCFVQNKYI